MTLLRQNVEIKEQLRIMTTMLQEIVRKKRSGEGSVRGRLPGSIKLPLTDFEDVEALEEQLRSIEISNQLVIFVCFYHFTFLISFLVMNLEASIS